MVVAITSLIYSSESRAKELNGLLETTLTKVSIDEAGDANICESKWVDKVKPDGSTKSRLVVQGFTQVWLKDYHDTFSAVASMTTFRILINIAAILGWDIFTCIINNIVQVLINGLEHYNIVILY